MKKSFRGIRIFSKYAGIGNDEAQVISKVPIAELPLEPDERLKVLASNSDQVQRFVNKWGLGLNNNESTLFSKSKQRRV